jgi:hypothetical protein
MIRLTAQVDMLKLLVGPNQEKRADQQDHAID